MNDNKVAPMGGRQAKIPIGISSCLLGHEVRYDGGHKKNDYIVKTLQQYFSFRSFCPEVESGMAIPRPPIQLRYTPAGIRCVGVKDHELDVTEQLQQSARSQLWLNEICGYILKKGSPSCGMERVKIYREDYPERKGTGVFAQYIKENYPLLPLEEEGRLCDPQLKENFIQRVDVLYRWKQFCQEPITSNRLQVFHSRHKLIAMSHDQVIAKELGRIVASTVKNNVHEVAEKYILALMKCMKIIATRNNHVNTLQHIQGYLKKKLKTDDKSELIEIIERYRLGQLPLIAPVTLLQHHFRKQPDTFINQSYYMEPHPELLANGNKNKHGF